MTRQLVVSAVDGRAAASGQIEDPASVVLTGSPSSPWRVRVAPAGGGRQLPVAEYGLTLGQACVYLDRVHPHGSRTRPATRAGVDLPWKSIQRYLHHRDPPCRGLPTAQLAVHGGRLVDFGAIASTDTVHRDVEIENAGVPAQVLTGSVTLAAGPSTFAITQGGGAFQLSAGQRKTIGVAFVRPTPGSHASFLIISSNDRAAPARRIDLRGENNRARVWTRVFIAISLAADPATGDCFGGDDRGYQPFDGTSRLEQVVEFGSGNGAVFLASGQPGVTSRIHCLASELLHEQGYRQSGSERHCEP